jgi:hypothetical protein
VSRTLDPRAQRVTGRGFAPVSGGSTPIPAWLGTAIRDGGDPWEPEVARDWTKPLAIPEGAEPVVLRSLRRGVLHRGWRDRAGKLGAHPRCHAIPPRDVLPKGAEFWFSNLRDDSRLCRYPWCFRQVVRELGVIPVVGHYSRRLRGKRALARQEGAESR